MPTRDTTVRHFFSGGWSTDMGLVTNATPNEAGLVGIPFLSTATNMSYEFDGGVKKIGGTVKLNATAAGDPSPVAILGMHDYWRMGTANTPTQDLIVAAGTTLYKMDALDGTLDDLTGAFVGANMVFSFAQFDDELIIMMDGNNDTHAIPHKYDQTTLSDLGSNAPNCAFGVTHKNRFWMAGDDGAPSRLYYSPTLPSGADGDWQGAGSGDIQLDPGDGDKITGLVSYKDRLFIFKGPYKGSIHMITGSAPTGSDAFARITFVRGVGCVAHNTIVTASNDVIFMWSDGSIRSLTATEKFGDLKEAALSTPIHNEIQSRTAFDNLKYAHAVVDTSRSQVIFAVPWDSETYPSVLLMMDYRFNPPRWALWDHLRQSASRATVLASVIDTTNANKHNIFVGGRGGFIRKLNQDDRSIDGTDGYTMQVTTPYINYGDPFRMKTLTAAAVGITPMGKGTATFAWQRDGTSSQSETFSVAGGGEILGKFLIGTDLLGTGAFLDRFMDTVSGGEFRSIAYTLIKGGVDEELEAHTISVQLAPGGISLEN